MNNSLGLRPQTAAPQTTQGAGLIPKVKEEVKDPNNGSLKGGISIPTKKMGTPSSKNE